MKQTLRQLVTHALTSLDLQDAVQQLPPPGIQIDRTKDKSHGDFACNIAMVLAKPLRRNPRELAQAIITALPVQSEVERVEIAGPGFINFYLQANYQNKVVSQILQQGNEYGRSKLGAGQRVLLEFVSANPNGPLHIGHGRGAAYGAVLGSLLQAAGYQVDREYYVNDAGRQMDILAVSLWFRYLERLGETTVLPANSYRGAYVKDMATDLETALGRQLYLPVQQIEAASWRHADDPDSEVDTLIQLARTTLLGPERYRLLHRFGIDWVLKIIQQDLHDFGVDHDIWFSEQSLTDDGSVDRAIAQLRDNGQLVTREGAVWFRSTDFGDEKDRVVVRENGQKTYFASDIAYHQHKFELGYDLLINIWGADHHGYIARVKAALQALKYDPARLEILLVQFATLWRGEERVQMSTRSGEFITLRELFEEVGKDAARFFYVMRRSEQHLDFDLELAKSQSNDNPVYYIQYAHARICSVFRQMQEKGYIWSQETGKDSLGLLTEAHEQMLITTLASYPELVETAARAKEPHQIANYLRGLASDFHAYYNEHKVLVEGEALRNARLNLSAATRQVLRHGLELLGVSAPEAM